jgi:hypothetical protein
MVTPNDNFSSFFIFSTMDIKSLLVGPIDELFLLILEELEPSRVSAPDLHVVCSSSISDVP